jgi:hypothetical protein
LIAAYLRLGGYTQAIATADEALARHPTAFFGQLRALADSSLRAKAPAGAIRIVINVN